MGHSLTEVRTPFIDHSREILIHLGPFHLTTDWVGPLSSFHLRHRDYRVWDVNPRRNLLSDPILLLTFHLVLTLTQCSVSQRLTQGISTRDLKGVYGNISLSSVIGSESEPLTLRWVFYFGRQDRKLERTEEGEVGTMFFVFFIYPSYLSLWDRRRSLCEGKCPD